LLDPLWGHIQDVVIQRINKTFFELHDKLP